MKAIICEKYGDPHVLKHVTIETPKPKNHEILIKVHATAVNSADVRIRSLRVGGTLMSLIARLVFGLSGPRHQILGGVMAGVVTEVGSEVADFKIGDEVYAMDGMKMGGYAEYATFSSHKAVWHKPKNASFEEAVSILFGGSAAWYYLEKARLKQAKNILVYGATGAVGTSAVQIAHMHEVKVTAVCSEDGEGLVKSLGASTVIDYKKEDFTRIGETFDILFDAVGHTSKKACAMLLSEQGTFTTVDSLDVAKERKEDLKLLTEWYEQGKLTAVIDRIYPLDEIVQAHEYVDTGRKKGSVVVVV